MEPRLARSQPESERPYAPGESEFRTDLERIRFAQSFSRLAEVTQVVTAGASSGVVHNRLTHTIKVTAVARSIAVRLLRTEDRDLLRDLGGLDHVVVQAAANAHDLGHPPFGHLGERVLDRLARERFGLADGFEGNAQTFRILTELEVHGPGDEGLNLTAAVRAAVLKYPWARFHYPSTHPTDWSTPPRGAGHGRGGTGAAKFSTYVIDLPGMLDALRAFPELPPGRQTLECSVMDLADDIAYSLHDVEDFHRSGVLQFSPVSGEFRSWESGRATFAAMTAAQIARAGRQPGAGLERLRRNLRTRDSWMFDEATFSDAVATVGDEFVDGVLAAPYDGSMKADRAISGFTSRWIDHLITSVRPDPEPEVRSGYVCMSSQAWHEVSVLKFVNQYFILERPDLAMFQRGQEKIIEQLVVGFDDWLSDRLDAGRAPRRMVDLVNAATYGYERIANTHPEWLGAEFTDADLARMGRGRGIVDFVSSLTDAQAVAYAARLGGASGLLWVNSGLSHTRSAAARLGRVGHAGPVELLGEVWRRATSVQPAPPPGLIALTALAAFVLVALPSIWPYTRVMITITHEGGHAFAALLTGRKLQGIRLHTDTSGLTISSGRPRGPGMVIMLLSGYLAPALVGLGAVALLLAGHSLGLLWLLVIFLGLMLIKIRNIYGVVVIIGCAAGLLAISWYAGAPAQSSLAYLITWILLLASPKPVLELISQRRRHRMPQSDADQLSRLSKVPASLWLIGFLVINFVGLLVGAALLLPALAELAANLLARLTAA